MPYELYKIIHLGSVFFLVAYTALYFHMDQVAKPVKILTGIFSFLIFLGGMGMMARLGIGHGGAWPHWLVIKTVLWLLLAILIPVLGKRLGKDVKPKAFYGLMFLFVLTAYFAIYKPF